MMPDPDKSLSDHEWKLKMAAEGKAIYIPGKTAEQMETEAAAEALRLAQVSPRTIELTEADWRALDTAIPDAIQMFEDAARVFMMLGYTDDLGPPEINSLTRMAARALHSMLDREMMVLDRLDSTMRRSTADLRESERQADLEGRFQA